MRKRRAGSKTAIIADDDYIKELEESEMKKKEQKTKKNTRKRRKVKRKTVDRVEERSDDKACGVYGIFF